MLTHLLTVDSHLGRYAGEDCGFDVVSVSAAGLSTLDELCTFLLANIYVREDSFVLLLSDLRALEGIRAPLVADDRDL